MQSSSRFKLITAFCLFVIFAVSLLFLGFTRLPTHAAGSALHKNGKIPASSTSQGAWNVVYSPNVRTGSDFYGVAAISSNDVWAVGSVIEHWNGTKWRVVSNPIPSTANSPGFLRGVTAVSANDVWAVGYFYDFVNKLFVTQTLIKHWNGTAWRVVASPNVGTSYNFLMSVAAISTNDVWAVGYYNTSSGQGTLTEHWDGSSWSVIHSRNVGANGSSFRSVAGASTNDVWAVGYIGWRRTLTEHWDGKNWSVVFSPNPPKSDSGFDGVTVISSNDVWAVGSTLNVGKYFGPETLTEHWNGTSWSIIPSPNINTGTETNYLLGVAAASSNDVWAVGLTYTGINKGMWFTLTEHWNGTSWSIISSPNIGTGGNFLNGVAMVSSNDVWAVGTGNYKRRSAAVQTLAEHWSSAG